ncbi:MAG: hypothetical protein GC189_04205 [Alphaproteobacteria bacterium]|nr:hypothetical protein [Alphaproteobacteria bacterium]
MTQPEPPLSERAPQRPNPERRSDAAILCFLIGAGLIGAAWLLGLGGVLAMALSGGAEGAIAGGLASLILLPLTAAVGLLLLVIGGIWIVVRVIADSREHDAQERYSRDVER